MSMEQMLAIIFLGLVSGIWILFMASVVADIVIGTWFKKKTEFVTNIVLTWADAMQKAAEKKAAGGREKPPDGAN